MSIESATKPAPWNACAGLVDGQDAELWRDLVLFWPLWAAENGASDISGTGMHGTRGTALGLDAWVATEKGMALNFTDSSANEKMLIAVNDAVGILDDTATLSCLVTMRADTVPGVGDRMGFIGKYSPTTAKRSWRIELIEGGEIQVYVSADGTAYETQSTTGAGFSTATWYQMLWTFDAGTTALYLDGTAQTLGTVTTSYLYGADWSFDIGNRPDTLGLDGQIADVRVWRRALSAADARHLADRPWGMLEAMDDFPSYSVEHSGGAAAGPWMLWGAVPAGTQATEITGLENAISYDVRCDTVDTSENTTTGTTIESGTPAAAAATSTGLPKILRPPSRYPPWWRFRR